jgi:hypothetical protein
MSPPLGLALLDAGFILFHTVLIAFNLFGWCWRRTRRANLVTLTLTGLSWTVLGIWYGLGYCPCTDWHWQVRYRMGDYDLPRSYLKFLFDRATGWEANPVLVDGVAAVAFLLAVLCSLFVNVRDLRRTRRDARLGNPTS